VFRHGTGAAKIRSIELLERCSRPSTAVEFNDEVTLRVHVEYLATCRPASSASAFEIARARSSSAPTRSRRGSPCRRARRVDAGRRLSPAAAASAGTYSVSSAIAADRYTRAYFDWIDNALVVTVSPPPSGKAIHGQVWLPVEIAVHPS
jgi:hypothetical protein